MTRTLTIRIRTLDDALGDFRKSFKAAEAGRHVARHDAVSFTSIEAIRNLLTPNRLALLRAIRHRRPRSIYELAQIVRRDFKNVQGDLKILERYGLVAIAKRRGVGKRLIKTPRSLVTGIAVKVAI